MTNEPTWDTCEFARWDLEPLDDPSALFAGGDWHRVRDRSGSLPPYAVRISTDDAGRYTITGVLVLGPVSGDKQLPVTAKLMRDISLAEVARIANYRTSGSLPYASLGSVEGGIEEFVTTSEAIASGAARSMPVEQAPKVGRRGPSHDDLVRFAELYRAMRKQTTFSIVRLAREARIDRASVYRWRRYCERAGIDLPALERPA